MKKTTRKTLLPFLAMVLALVSGPALGSHPSAKGVSKILSNKNHHLVHGMKIKMNYRITGCRDTELNAAINGVKSASKSAKWDDDWYFIKVPQGQCLVFGWYNLDDNTYGWAAAENAPNTWYVRSNSSSWQSLGNEEQKKYSYRIQGTRIDLDIYNPKNTAPFTGNDIFFSFGY